MHFYFICALFLILWLLHYNTFASPPLELQIVAMDVKQSTSQLFLFVCSCVRVCVSVCTRPKLFWTGTSRLPVPEVLLCGNNPECLGWKCSHTERQTAMLQTADSWSLCSCELHLRVGWSHTVMLDIQSIFKKKTKYFFFYFFIFQGSRKILVLSKLFQINSPTFFFFFKVIIYLFIYFLYIGPSKVTVMLLL